MERPAKRPSSRSLAEVMADARKRRPPSDTDVRFRLSDGTEERAERELLAERCEKFSTALSGPWNDVQRGATLDATHREPAVVRAFVTYLHSDLLPEDGELETLVALMEMADEFLFERLRDECRARLRRLIDDMSDEERVECLKQKNRVLSDVVWNAYESLLNRDIVDHGPILMLKFSRDTPLPTPEFLGSIKSGGEGGIKERLSKLVQMAIGACLPVDDLVRLLRIAYSRRAETPSGLARTVEEWCNHPARRSDDAEQLRKRLPDALPLAALPTHALVGLTWLESSQLLEALRVRSGEGFLKQIQRAPHYASRNRLSPERLSFFSADLQAAWSVGEATDASASPFLWSASHVRVVAAKNDDYRVLKFLGDGPCTEFECEIRLTGQAAFVCVGFYDRSSSSSSSSTLVIHDALAATVALEKAGGVLTRANVNCMNADQVPRWSTRCDGQAHKPISSVHVQVRLDTAARTITFITRFDRDECCWRELTAKIPPELWSDELLPAVYVRATPHADLLLRGTKSAENPFIVVKK